MTQKLDISTSTFVRLILLLLAIAFLYLVRDVLVLLFIVAIIVAGLSPSVSRWAKYITRPGAVILLFVLIFILLSLALSLLVPPLANQIQEFSHNLPNYTSTLNQTTTGSGFIQQASRLVIDNLNNLSGSLSNIGGSLFSHTLGLISGVVGFITVFVLSFYLLLEEDGVKKIYQGLVPQEYQQPLNETIRKISEKLGAWLRGQVLLMAIVGLATAVGLSIIGLPYALALGIWAGLTEVVPIIGPWIGALPGVVVGLSKSPLYGLLALIIYVLVQQSESNFLVPRIMGRAVGLNPVVVIIAILIGDKLYGITGILVSVPLAAVISVIAEDWSVIRGTFSGKA